METFWRLFGDIFRKSTLEVKHKRIKKGNKMSKNNKNTNNDPTNKLLQDNIKSFKKDYSSRY